VPLSKIVVLDVGILAEQSFDHVPRIVKDERWASVRAGRTD
jgi:hypothetical protein